MRISDWSSDVCSSDLLDLGIQLNTLHLGAVGVDCGGDLRVRQVAACEGTRFDHRRRIDRVGDRLVEGGDAQDAATADIIFGGETEVGRRQRAEDRKSVVEGKSVSVRVDLGGGRLLIKKKKKI